MLTPEPATASLCLKEKALRCLLLPLIPGTPLSLWGGAVDLIFPFNQSEKVLRPREQLIIEGKGSLVRLGAGDFSQSFKYLH